MLTHRLRVILEGQRQMPAPAMPEVERHGELAFYPSTARAIWQQRDTGLTVTEYKIVRLLVSGRATNPTAPFMLQRIIQGSSPATALSGHHECPLAHKADSEKVPGSRPYTVMVRAPSPGKLVVDSNVKKVQHPTGGRCPSRR